MAPSVFGSPFSTYSEPADNNLKTLSNLYMKICISQTCILVNFEKCFPEKISRRQLEFLGTSLVMLLLVRTIAFAALRSNIVNGLWWVSGAQSRRALLLLAKLTVIVIRYHLHDFDILIRIRSVRYLVQHASGSHGSESGSIQSVTKVLVVLDNLAVLHIMQVMLLHIPVDETHQINPRHHFGIDKSAQAPIE